MEYKDALGHPFVVGDRVAYSVSGGAIQIGRILALTTMNVQDYTKLRIPGKTKTCDEVKCSSFLAKQPCYFGNKHPWTRDKYPMKKIPAIKVQGAYKSYKGDKFEKLNPSLLSKFENIIAINSNLTATVTLM